MEVALKTEKYNRFEPVWHEITGGEFAADCVVPDTMPDIRDLLNAEGTLLLRSKTTEAGCVALTASVQGMVVYFPENEAMPRCLSVSVPVEMRLDAPQIQEDCRTVCRMRIRSLDAKMVNSRKISVRADVAAEVWCYGEDVLELPCGLGQDEVCAHILMGTASVVHVSDVREKAFVITDQFSLPGGLSSVGDILSQRAEVHTEDVKFVSGKVVFRGHVSTELLLAGLEDGQLIPARYETEFSQIMEADVTGEDAVPEVMLQLTGVYFDLPAHENSSGKIGAEMHMAAQCICRKKQDVTYMEDLYSNKKHLILECGEILCDREMQPVTMRQTVTGRSEFAGEGEVVCTSASVSGVTTEGETVKTAVTVRLVIRQSNGQYGSVRCRLGAEFTTELPADAELQNVTVRVTDVFCSASAGAADVRVVLQMDGWRVMRRVLTCVQNVSVDESAESSGSEPSITLVRADNMDLWSLAKQYRSSPEAIEAANEGNNSGLLLIPKSR